MYICTYIYIYTYVYMILDMYKGCSSIIHIWSPSIEVGSTWKPVKDYIRDHIKPNDRDKLLF